MLRLPQMVGTLVFVACAGCTIAAGQALAAQATPESPGVCADRGAPPGPQLPDVRSNDELMASEAFQRAIADVVRLGIVTGFCELRPDTLTLDLDKGAFTVGSTDYNLSRVFAAYRGLTEYSPATALELRYQERLVGRYTVEGVLWTEKPQPPPAPPPLQAQRTADSTAAVEDRRRGLHFNAGLGGGSFDQQCRGCDFESDLGVSGVLSLGAWLGRKSVAGVEATGWVKEESDRRTKVYSVMATLTRYLSESSGLFLRAGAGLVGYADGFDRTAMGPGFSGRIGYEFGSGKVHVVPYVGYVRSFDGTDLESDGEDLGFNFVISQLQFGLGVSVY